MAITSGTEVLSKAAAGRQAPSEIAKAVQVASAQSGVDFAYLLEKAAVESNFNAQAKARGSSAAGLFQFIESTWLAMVREHGAAYGYDRYAAALQKGKLSSSMRREILDLRFDPKASALMAAEYTKENKAYLERTVGGEITETDLYMAHFLGAGGAGKFIKAMRENPDQPAADLFPRAARANKPIFYKDGRACTLAEIHARFAAKFGTEACPDLPAAATAVAAAGDAEARLDAAMQSSSLFDSLYFSTLTPDVPAEEPDAPDQEQHRRQAQAASAVGDWAFLRPAGGNPLMALADTAFLPASLSFTVQMALAALDAPGGDATRQDAKA